MNGVGVDVILNSLAGDAIPRNLRLLRPFGRMLELGKRDFYENSQVGLRPFRNNIAYFGIDADQLLEQRPDTARRVFVDLMALFADGTLHPLPHRTFDASDIAGATPLYGTFTMSTLASALKSSVARCARLPTPTEA